MGSDADPSIRNGDGNTAYELATMRERTELLAILPAPGSWQEKLRVCADETNPVKIRAAFDRAMIAEAPETRQAVEAAWSLARADNKVDWQAD